MFRVLLFVTLLFLASCKEDTLIQSLPIVHSFAFTLNGGGYTNATYMLSTPAYPMSGAVRNPDSTTWIHVYGGPGSVPQSIDMLCQGDTVGLYQWNSDFARSNSVTIFMTSAFEGPDMVQLVSWGAGITEITAYGGVGEMVSGNFSGKLLPRLSSDTVDVTGTFSVTRIGK